MPPEYTDALNYIYQPRLTVILLSLLYYESTFINAGSALCHTALTFVAPNLPLDGIVWLGKQRIWDLPSNKL